MPAKSRKQIIEKASKQKRAQKMVDLFQPSQQELTILNLTQSEYDGMKTELSNTRTTASILRDSIKRVSPEDVETRNELLNQLKKSKNNEDRLVYRLNPERQNQIKQASSSAYEDVKNKRYNDLQETKTIEPN